MALASASPGAGGSAPATMITGGYESGSIPRGELVRAPLGRSPQLGAASSRAVADRGRIRLRYYIGSEPQSVASGVAQLFEIGCPHRLERPVTGGTFAAVPGLVIVNSSRTNPEPGLATAKRAWYEAVVNITSEPLQWKPFVTCAKSS